MSEELWSRFYLNVNKKYPTSLPMQAQVECLAADLEELTLDQDKTLLALMLQTKMTDGKKY